MQQKPQKTVILIAFMAIFDLTNISGQEMPCVILKKTDVPFTVVYQAPLQEDTWFGRDKVLHFAFSMFLFTGSYAVQKDALSVKKPAVYSAGFTFSLGLGKEIYDYSRPPNFFSWKDMLWNCAGTGTGFALTKAAMK